jgi:hypothetical protein
MHFATLHILQWKLCNNKNERKAQPQTIECENKLFIQHEFPLL